MSAKRIIQAFCLEHSYSEKDNLFIKRLKKEGFNNEQIVKIIMATENTCPICYDNDRGCTCAINQ